MAARLAGADVRSYEYLWRWSVAELDEFWRTIVEYFEVRFGAGGETVLADRRMPGAQWFPGTTVSYPEHIFRGRDDDEVPTLHTSETRLELASWTWGELRPADGPGGRGSAGAGRWRA